MCRIFAIANQKGGVGKTTTAVNVSAYLASMGHRVLLVDIDPQANATSSLACQGPSRFSIYHVLMREVPLAEVVLPTQRPDLDILPSSTALAGAEVELVPLLAREYRLQRALAEIQERYDHIFIDCPPSLGLLTVNALTAAQRVLVPVQCEYLSLEGLSLLLKTMDLVRRNLNPRLRLSGLVLTMFDPRLKLAQEVAREIRQHFPNAYYAIIPRSVRLSEAPSHGQSIFEYDPSSRGAQAYAALAEEILAKG